MRDLLKALFKDECGIIISSEVVLVGTILVVGSLVGLSALSWAINQELNDVANAVSARPDYGYPQSGDASYPQAITSSQGVTEVVGY